MHDPGSVTCRQIGGSEVTASYRPATPDDWDAMAEAANRARRADGIDEVRSGRSMADEYPEYDALTMPRDVLIAEVDGAVVGYIMGYLTLRDGILTCETHAVVAPEHRRQGIGTALWTATRDRLAIASAAEPVPGQREMRTFALDIATDDRAFLAAMGYVPIRFGFEMRRFLTGVLPDHPLPAGLEMRTAVEAEYRAIFDADVEAFKDHWGIRPKSDMDFQARFNGVDVDPTLYLAAWDGDQVAGVVLNAIFTEENSALGIRRGWLEHVSVRRPWRGRGVAKALMVASMRLLRERGMDEAWLGVDGTNRHGAVRLYANLGFTVTRRWQVYARPVDGPAPPGWRSGDGAAGPG